MEPKTADLPAANDGDDGGEDLGLIEVRLEHKGAHVRATGMPAALADLVRHLGDEAAVVNGIPPIPPAAPAASEN